MTVFCIKLAGIPIEINAAYESTKDFCQEYLTDEEPLFSVQIVKKDIDRTREDDRRTSILEGREIAVHSDKYLERLAICYAVLGTLLKHDILLMHGTVVAIKGKAYLFTAKSGTGKTTHCSLWLKNFPESHILNGDKPLVLFKDGKIFACGSPWMGKEKYGINEILPLEAVCILERNKINTISEITLKDCFDKLMDQCYIPDGNESILRIAKKVQEFNSIHLFRLGCNMEDEAAFVSYDAMVK